MPFLAITCFLMYANLIAAFRYLIPTSEVRSVRLCSGHMLACLVSSVGFLLGTELLVLDRDGGIAGNAFNWTPVAYLGFGLISLMLFGLKLYRRVRRPDAHQGIGVRLGLTLWSVLASAYICAATIDHFVFFHDHEHTGVMDAAFSGEQLTCSGEVILVRIKRDTAVYRCPQSVRLGRDYGAPFVPWPSYIEGSSTKLKAKIDEVMEGSTKSRAVVAVPSGDIKVMPNKAAD